MNKNKLRILFIFLFGLLLTLILGELIKRFYALDILSRVTDVIWLIIIAFFIVVYRLKDETILFLALIFTAIGAVLTLIRSVYNEMFFRIGFIFWIVGYIYNFTNIVKNRFVYNRKT